MNIENLAKQIKLNCDISDAKFWGYFSLCGLLLRLRELYRAEKNIKPWASINQKDIGKWINAKESLWAKLEEHNFYNINIDGFSLNPFEVSEINSLLVNDNIVYGAGLGLYKKPIFFLGELYSYTKKGDYQIYFIKKEYAHDLFTSSGMLQGKDIFIRLEQLLSLLWEIFLEFKCRKNGFFQDIFSLANISPEDNINNEFEVKLENLAIKYSEIILNHELAEAYETTDDWTNIIYNVEDRRVEYFLRRLKDIIADTSDFGPLKKIIEIKDRASLGFYLATSEMLHKAAYSELKEAICNFKTKWDWLILDDARKKILSRSLSLREQIRNAFREKSMEEFLKTIKDLAYLPQTKNT